MLIKVKVCPRSQRAAIVRKGEDHFVVYVKAKAQRGQANQEVKQMLCAYFQIPAARLRLVKGGRQQSKIFEIRN